MKRINGLRQAGGLFFKRSGRRGRLFDQRRVLLRNPVHLRNSLTDLNNTATLLIRGCRDVEHNIGDAFDGIHNLIHGAPRSDNLFRSLFNQADRCADQAFNLFCRLRAATGEGTNLTGDHRKTASLFPGACRLDRRVQRQNVGLESDTVNDGGNFRDFFRAGGNIPHRLYDPETIWPPRLALPEASSASLLA